MSNCFGSSEEPSQMRTDHSWYYCLHSWYHWLKKVLLWYAKLAYAWTCARLLSLLSHWSVYPSGTTQPLKLSYLTKQALCNPTPIAFSSFSQKYPGYSNLKFTRILDWNYIKAPSSPTALEILFYIYFCTQIGLVRVNIVCLSTLHIVYVSIYILHL